MILRKLDHAMIYVLIAGTYTPILLKYLPTLESEIFTIAIWACACIGIIIKLCWFFCAPLAANGIVHCYGLGNFV